MISSRLIHAALVTAAFSAPLAHEPAQTLPPGKLPNHDGSLKLLVIGDAGTGDRPQYDIAQRMSELRTTWRYDNVLMAGDNLYGSERPSDYQRKFEGPYAALLNDGVTFRAALGEQDEREQRYYKHFNMDGRTYYSWKPREQDARFFFLDSSDPDAAQLAWIETELRNANERWKIAVFHHPPYSTRGRSRSNLREAWEPLFVKHNVSAVFSGHEHLYERIRPQKGILYFIVGSSGKLSAGGIREDSPLLDAGFDRDHTFLAVEIADDVMHYQAITRTGRIVDSGTFTRRAATGGSALQPAVQHDSCYLRRP